MKKFAGISLIILSGWLVSEGLGSNIKMTIDFARLKEGMLSIFVIAMTLIAGAATIGVYARKGAEKAIDRLETTVKEEFKTVNARLDGINKNLQSIDKKFDRLIELFEKFLTNYR